MKSIVLIVAACLVAISTGCVHRYSATIAFMPAPSGRALEVVELRSNVAGALSSVVTMISIDSSLATLVEQEARFRGYVSATLESLKVSRSEVEGEMEVIRADVRVLTEGGEVTILSGETRTFGTWIRGLVIGDGLKTDFVGVQVTPNTGSFREFAMSDAAVLRAALQRAIEQAFKDERQPNQALQTTPMTRSEI
ncbi:hypothetical protein ASA1KI_03820 [Opitutales bacterium ASA1]|uniref:hypothetical protein n=1 Tax=Congregicoccus parvus TaxID=3081749 RepID=UPI002B28353B|nr:hypothetical protein ASA1KI_03820 [Opitutales bacterium ASA1]